MSTMSNDKRATKPGHSTSPLSRRTLIALTALCIVSLLGHIALLPHMPEMIPTHWTQPEPSTDGRGAPRLWPSMRCPCYSSSCSTSSRA